MLKNYIWFVKESQNFMTGSNKLKVFLLSLFKGFGFAKNMNEYDKINKKCLKENGMSFGKYMDGCL